MTGRNFRPWRRFTAFFFAALAGPAAAEPLLVTFPDKPPYYYFIGKVPKGLLLERVRRVFDAAGIAVEFAARPAKRALYEIANGGQPLCSLGWFRLPEREDFAQFSLPLHRDAQIKLLVSQRRQAEISQYAGLQALLQAGRLRLGLVEGFSYGAEVDAWLHETKGPIIRAPVTVKQLMQMVAHGRVDLALVDDLEFRYRGLDPELARLELAAVSLPDIPAGNLRYLMCSPQVDAGTMARINAAIVKLGYQP